MQASFVLVHGGAHGGWCYQRVARLLRRRGHDVYTPTLTGYGDRGHLDQPGITVETHVEDVVSLIEYEDLHDVVLVGHSLGGVVIPRVAERVRERIRRVVWLAALVLDDGEQVVSRYAAASEWLLRAVVAGPDGEPRTDLDLLMEAFLQDGSPEDRAWVRARLGNTPAAALSEPGRLTRFLELGLPTGYIVALRDQSLPPELCREFAARLPGCRILAVDASHDLMISAPEATAESLAEMAGA